MHIAIVGATGGTGRQLVTQALDRGHEVTAVARRPEAVGIQHPCLRVAKGDVYNVPSLVAAFQGADAAIYAVGIASPWEARKPTTIYSEGSGNVMQAMQEAGVKRLIAISSGGIEPKPGDPWWFTNLLKPLFLKGMYEDMAKMERRVQEAGEQKTVLYTLVRPPQLLDGPWTGVYHLSTEGGIPDDKGLSRGDLAHFILDTLEAGAYENAGVDVAY
ncbi:MAG: NAD(P)-dependent oxidoreductase [Armatimonadaceae bacterium]